MGIAEVNPKSNNYVGRALVSAPLGYIVRRRLRRVSPTASVKTNSGKLVVNDAFRQLPTVTKRVELRRTVAFPLSADRGYPAYCCHCTVG